VSGIVAVSNKLNKELTFMEILQMGRGLNSDVIGLLVRLHIVLGRC
jgi:hypothetical protein